MRHSVVVISWCAQTHETDSITHSLFRSLPRACLISRRRYINSIIFANNQRWIMSKIAVKKGLDVVRVMLAMCANLPPSYWLLLPTVMQCGTRHLPKTSGGCDLWPTHFTPRQSRRIRGNDVTRSRSSQGILGIEWRCQSAIFQCANNISCQNRHHTSIPY